MHQRGLPEGQPQDWVTGGWDEDWWGRGDLNGGESQDFTIFKLVDWVN